jgi:hypothetical protein
MKRTRSGSTKANTKKARALSLYAAPPSDGASPFAAYFPDAVGALSSGKLLDAYDFAILRLVSKGVRALIARDLCVSTTRALLSLCHKDELAWLEESGLPVSDADVVFSFVEKPHTDRHLTILSDFFDVPYFRWPKAYMEHFVTHLHDTRSLTVLFINGVSLHPREWVERLALSGTEAMKAWYRKAFDDDGFDIEPYCVRGQWDMVRALVALDPSNSGIDRVLLSFHSAEAASIYTDFGGVLHVEMFSDMLENNHTHWLRAFVEHADYRDQVRVIVDEILRECDYTALNVCFLMTDEEHALFEKHHLLTLRQ